jgi:hypothetical protein
MNECDYNPNLDSGPFCLFCQMGMIYDGDVLFSPSVGDYFHPNCARLIINMHEMQQKMDFIEEARLCIIDLETQQRNRA